MFPHTGNRWGYVTSGVDTITESVSSISSQPVTLRYLDAAYVMPGANTMPSGGTLNMNGKNGTPQETSPTLRGDRGTVGSPDADGHTVDVQFSSSAGDSGTLRVDGNSVAPAQMATMPQSSMRAAMSAAGAHTMGKWGAVAVVGGVVAAGLGVVAAGLGVAAAVSTAPVGERKQNHEDHVGQKSLHTLFIGTNYRRGQR